MFHLPKLLRNMSQKVFSISSLYSFPSFWQKFNSTSKKTTHLLSLTTSRFRFWHLHKNDNAAKPDHAPLIKISVNRRGQSLVNTPAVGLPISAFPSMLSSALQNVVLRCYVAKSLFDSARVVDYFLLLGSTASIVVDRVPS